MDNIQFSLYLDKRRKKKNGTYPLKLQLYIPEPKTQKYYSTIFSFTEAEFEKYYLTTYKRIPREVKDVKVKLNAILLKAKETAKNIEPFSIDVFEKRLFVNKGKLTTLKYHYEDVISEYKKQERLNTASNYDLSLKSFQNFVESKGKIIDKLKFTDITINWLNEYEAFMIESGKSISTVGIYLRPLRAVFNRAIESKDVKAENYPFGKNKYQIPQAKRSKKALSKQELKILFDAEPQTPQQQKAKDFWFFSFNCNGMNIKDIALLKYKDFDKDKFQFYRAKTKFTSKTQLEKITIYLNQYTESIIQKYGNNKAPESYVFDILKSTDTPQQQRQKIQAFTRNINQHIKLLAENNGITGEISTYWARHSFATHSIRKGASMEFMRESLGHKDMKTTQNYFNGFDNDTKKEFAQNIMDFD